MKRPIKETITGAMQVRLRTGTYGPMMVVVAVAGLALALILYQRTIREQQVDTRLAFEHLAMACAADVDREDDRGEALVQSLGAFVEATERMDRDRFHIFCAAAVRRDSCAQALEWVPRVPHDRREEYEAAARNEGLADFRFTERGAPGGTVPADLRDEYFPAYYVEPLAGNEVDVGFDLGSDPVRLAALVKAAETGGLVATPRLTLAQGTGAQFGYLMAQPVYETGALLGSAEDRRRHLRGFVLGVFHIGAIVESALAEAVPAGLDLYLLDDDAPAAERFLYHHASRTRLDPTQTGPEDLSKPALFEYRAPISAADRMWTLVIRPAPSFLAAHRSGEAYAVAAAVAALTAAAIGLIFLLGRAARHNVLLLARQAESLRFQDALKASEARHRTLFESSRDAIMTVEPPSWQFTSGNPATVSMFKAASEQDFTAHEPWTLSPERQPDGRASADKAKEMIETAMRDGSHFFEWTHCRINGESFPATVLLSRMETDGKVFLQATVRDISEIKQAEEALQKTERQLAHAMNLAQLVAWDYDVASGLFTFSDRYYALHGTSAELEGGYRMSAEDFARKFVHPADAPAVGAEIGKALAATDPDYQTRLETRVLRRNGEVRYVLVFITIRKDAAGKTIQLHGANQDITEGKRQATERRELEKKVQERQKLAAVGTLACGMGHEINNPIMGIINYAQLIKDRLQGKNEALEEFAGEIVIEAERIAGIVRGLSAFATRDIATRAAVPVTDLVESALAPLRDALTHSQIALEVDVPDNLPSVVCDRGQIAQAVTSLLSNARDALNERYPEHDDDKIVRIGARVVGDRSSVNSHQLPVISDQLSVTSDQLPLAGGSSLASESTTNNQHTTPNAQGKDVGCRTLDVGRSDSLKTVTSSQTGLTSDFRPPTSDLWVRITVEDHGAGIPLDVREHIFEPFFTTKDKSVGAGNIGKGLGLFVSHAYVQEHGGVLSVESEVGQWTRFCIDLPAVPADVPSASRLSGRSGLQADLSVGAGEQAGEQWTGDQVNEG